MSIIPPHSLIAGCGQRRLFAKSGPFTEFLESPHRADSAKSPGRAGLPASCGLVFGFREKEW